MPDNDLQDTKCDGVPLKVLIVGAGLEGLTAAIALRRAGHIVTIFEKSRFASEHGAAINVPPNATSILLNLGIEPAAAGAVRLNKIIAYSKQGDISKTIALSEISKDWHHPYLLAHRVDLHSQLKNAAMSQEGQGTPVELIVSSKVKDVDPHAGSVTLLDDTTFVGDLIIGADGLHSCTRKKLTSVSPRPSGKSAFRFLINKADALRNQNIRATIKGDGELIFWFDHSRRIVLYPTRNNEIWNFVCIYPDAAWEETDETWNRPGCHDDLLAVYKGFDERVLTLLRLADTSTLKVWRLMDMDPVHSWCTERLCLLGDAAHPFLPHQGQGAAQAMEDGASLGILFTLGVDTSEVPSRLQLYEQCRKTRAEMIQEQTRKSGHDIASGFQDHITRMADVVQASCSYDEQHHSARQLHQWLYRKERPNMWWHMPISFGPSPGPRQLLAKSTGGMANATFVTRNIKFKTSRALVDNFLPTPAFELVASGINNAAYASYIHTTLDKVPWLGGRGYDFLGLVFHGVRFRKKDGTTINGDFLAVMWENLPDPILTGREELGIPKLFCDLQVQQGEQNYAVEASWQGTSFLKLEMDGLVQIGTPDNGNSNNPILSYKYIPATGRCGVADVEYAVCSPKGLGSGAASKCWQSHTSKITIGCHESGTIPTLHYIVERLVELPVLEIIDATVSSGRGLDNLSSTYRVE